MGRTAYQLVRDVGVFARVPVLQVQSETIEKYAPHILGLLPFCHITYLVQFAYDAYVGPEAEHQRAMGASGREGAPESLGSGGVGPHIRQGAGGAMCLVVGQNVRACAGQRNPTQAM